MNTNLDNLRVKSRLVHIHKREKPQYNAQKCAKTLPL
mgnify:CR=1 FL=1|jgi:hypothetical protein